MPDIWDLWMDDKPAYGMNGTDYEEYIFADRIYNLVNNFSKTAQDEPFFLVYTPQLSLILFPLYVSVLVTVKYGNK